MLFIATYRTFSFLRAEDKHTGMSFLFGRPRRTNTVDLPKQAKEQFAKLDSPGKVGVPVTAPKWRGVMLTACQLEELAKTLSQMKFILQGTSGRSRTGYRWVTLTRRRNRKQSGAGLLSSDRNHSRGFAVPTGSQPTPPSLRVQKRCPGHLLVRLTISTCQRIAQK